MINDAYEQVREGEALPATSFAVTRETIRAFCDASLDHNPLHLDDDYMRGSFGKTQFGGIIMHGMTNFGLLTRMLTDWGLACDSAENGAQALQQLAQGSDYDLLILDYHMPPPDGL